MIRTAVQWKIPPRHQMHEFIKKPLKAKNVWVYQIERK